MSLKEQDHDSFRMVNFSFKPLLFLDHDSLLFFRTTYFLSLLQSHPIIATGPVSSTALPIMSPTETINI